MLQRIRYELVVSFSWLVKEDRKRERERERESVCVCVCVCVYAYASIDGVHAVGGAC